MLCIAGESELEGQKDEAEGGERCDEAGVPPDTDSEVCLIISIINYYIILIGSP